jgi:hypothetical protein
MLPNSQNLWIDINKYPPVVYGAGGDAKDIDFIQIIT